MMRDPDTDLPIKPLPQAFELREGESSLSVNWAEFFATGATPTDILEAARASKATAMALSSKGKVSPRTVYAYASVGSVRACCAAHGNANVRIVHDGSRANPSHSSFRQFGQDQELLSLLANEVFASYLLDSQL
jgi:hypothetical protein